MADSFYKVCAILALFFLLVIASKSRVQPEAPRAQAYRAPRFQVVETELDAAKMNELLKKHFTEGQWELWAPPISRPGEKALLILVQRW